MLICSGILFGIWLDDAMVGGLGNYFGKLECEKMVFPDKAENCISLRNASIAWLFVLPSISGFLSFAFFAQKLVRI